jgi:hypothetical protein
MAGRSKETGFTFEAVEAVRQQILLRAGFAGTTGSGKSYTAYMLGARMVEKMGLGPMFVIDSENRSALRYAFSPRTGKGFHFKHVAMPSDDYSPQRYMAAIDFCERSGAGVIIIDSLSHAWNGINGVLEQVDSVTEKSRNPKDTFGQGWKTMTPIQNDLIARILSSSVHVIFTLRSKTHYEVVENDRGRKEPVKMGLQPIQRDGVDYEPDMFFDMTAPDNVLWVGKSRALGMPDLAPGVQFKKPDVDFADLVIAWLEDGEVAPPKAAPAVAPTREVSAAELVERAKSAQTPAECESVLLAAPKWVRVRAHAWSRLIVLSAPDALDALVARIEADIQDEAIRSKLKAEIAARASATPAPPAQPAPSSTGAASNGTAPSVSDEARLNAIDQGLV